MSARIVCFGELLARLTAPGRERLLQSPRLDVNIGGAEANVAVALAAFGHDAAVASRVPDNALGAAAVGELRRHDVDTRGIDAGPGRMGLYFLTVGAGHRPSEVLYDRAHSAFADAPADLFDWPALLAGARCLHLSGVTPALGATAAQAAIRAARAGREASVLVSFDGNFRSKLWQAWNGDAAAILREIVANADLVFADHRDVTVILGIDFPQATASERNRAAAAALFAAFPQVQRLVTTLRTTHSVDHHELSAMSIARDGRVQLAPTYPLTGTLHPIGPGDAFAAGVLHGVFAGMDDASGLHFGLGAACLKHSLPGDFLTLPATDVAGFIAEGRLDVRR